MRLLFGEAAPLAIDSLAVPHSVSQDGILRREAGPLPLEG